MRAGVVEGFTAAVDAAQEGFPQTCGQAPGSVRPCRRAPGHTALINPARVDLFRMKAAPCRRHAIARRVATRIVPPRSRAMRRGCRARGCACRPSPKGRPSCRTGCSPAASPHVRGATRPAPWRARRVRAPSANAGRCAAATAQPKRSTRAARPARSPERRRSKGKWRARSWLPWQSTMYPLMQLPLRVHAVDGESSSSVLSPKRKPVAATLSWCGAGGAPAVGRAAVAR
jgi:hypothetical protein